MEVYQLSDQQNLEVAFISLGARMISISFQKNNTAYQLHEYYSKLKRYKSERKYSGAVCGPVANRISQSNFSLDGEVFKFTPNEGDNLLHSGMSGLHQENWDVHYLSDDVIEFHCYRGHLEDGFPGNRIFKVKYTIRNGSILIDYTVSTDQKTILNLTSHGYFNLNGEGTLDDHQFKIKSNYYLPLDENNIPTGKLKEVDDSKFDFNQKRSLNHDNFDHNFCLNESNDKSVAMAKGLKSGIVMKVKTSQPGLQFYTGNGKYFCFETQDFPDAIHHPHFPSIIVEAGQLYQHFCEYQFS